MHDLPPVVLQHVGPVPARPPAPGRAGDLSVLAVPWRAAEGLHPVERAQEAPVDGASAQESGWGAGRLGQAARGAEGGGGIRGRLDGTYGAG